MDTKLIEDKLIQFLCSNFMVSPEEINWEESLVDQGVIDSFGLVEISAFLKREFEIEEAPENMTRENYGSVSRIVLFVEKSIE